MFSNISQRAIAIEPTNFGFNEEITDNEFMQVKTKEIKNCEVQEKALAAWKTYIENLEKNGIKTTKFKQQDPKCFDAV